MSSIAVFWLVAFLASGLGLVVYLIAADKKRFLASFELSQWRESYYLRALPNFLQALHDNHFRSPWPSRRNAVAAAYFRFRTHPLLKKRPPTLRRAFLRQHIALFALMEVLRPYIQDFILNEQQRIVGDRILEMEDTLDRDRLIAFLENVRDHRARFYRTLTNYDRQILVNVIDRKFIATLRTVHAIYQEHGYSLMEEFTKLRRWGEMTGADLVQELPALPTMHLEGLPSHLPARGQ